MTALKPFSDSPPPAKFFKRVHIMLYWLDWLISTKNKEQKSTNKTIPMSFPHCGHRFFAWVFTQDDIIVRDSKSIHLPFDSLCIFVCKFLFYGNNRSFFCFC